MTWPKATLVRFENDNGIGVITVDNPPVNALSPGVPQGIVAASTAAMPTQRSRRWC